MPDAKPKVFTPVRIDPDLDRELEKVVPRALQGPMCCAKRVRYAVEQYIIEQREYDNAKQEPESDKD